MKPEHSPKSMPLKDAPKQSTDELLPQVYGELRKLAQNKMNQESGDQTLSATALVHEAYLRVSKRDGAGTWEDKRHFFNAATEAMRRILIDNARAKNRKKRGGDLERDDVNESKIIAPMKDEELLAVDEALSELEKIDPEAAEIVKFRYFAGMTWEEISSATGIPDRTLRRRWTFAKTWLKDWLAK